MAGKKDFTSDSLQYAYNRYIGEKPEQVAVTSTHSTYSAAGWTLHDPRVAGSAMIAWHHDLGQAGELVVDPWTRDQRAQDELRDAYGHVGIDTLQ